MSEFDRSRIVVYREGGFRSVISPFVLVEIQPLSCTYGINWLPRVILNSIQDLHALPLLTTGEDRYITRFPTTEKMKGSCLINSSIVLGLRISAGKKIMCFPRFTFPVKTCFPQSRKRKLLKATERVAQENINAALSEIKGSNSFTKCGISIDGTWQRRGYSSLNGCVSAISVDTGKILDIEVMTQYCHICAKGNSQSSKHVCSNYKGSAGNMEVVGAYRIFERSNVRNVQHNEYYEMGTQKDMNLLKTFMELIQ
ncbi:uncharacterized protein TNCV_452621 [Trichonephila clavipes]|nr:uncharacterized protein TNCV_452621 [Trichonephila clavipes]